VQFNRLNVVGEEHAYSTYHHTPKRERKSAYFGRHFLHLAQNYRDERIHKAVQEGSEQRCSAVRLHAVQVNGLCKQERRSLNQNNAHKTCPNCDQIGFVQFLV